MCWGAIAGAAISGLGQASANAAANRNVQMAAAQQVRQIEQDTAEARARNERLMTRFIPAQEEFARQNQDILRDVFVTADGMAGRMGAEGDAREAFVLQAMGAPSAPPVRDNMNEVIRQAFEAASAAARGRAARDSGAAARLGGFEQSLVNDNERFRRSGQQIDRVNDFSRGDISLLGPSLALTGFQQQPPIPPVALRSGAAGQTMMQLGQAIGSGAFDDILSRAGRAFTPAVSAAPAGRASVPQGMPFFWNGR